MHIWHKSDIQNNGTPNVSKKYSIKFNFGEIQFIGQQFDTYMEAFTDKYDLNANGDKIFKPWYDQKAMMKYQNQLYDIAPIFMIAEATAISKHQAPIALTVVEWQIVEHILRKSYSQFKKYQYHYYADFKQPRQKQVLQKDILYERLLQPISDVLVTHTKG